MITCPECGQEISPYKNPALTVDIIIELYNDDLSDQPQIVLIRRKNEPLGLALPGGFVDYGERVESAAIREAKEETALDVTLVHLLGVYSDPERDPRKHTASVVFIATASGNPVAGDDAGEILTCDPLSIKEKLAFDHQLIIEDYISYCRSTT